MTWVRLDDAFAEHPKLEGLSDAAFRLHVGALCYCGRWNTDGVVPKSALSKLYRRNSQRRAAELLAAGIWHEEGHLCGACPSVEVGTYYLHGFLEYNPSAEAVDQARQERSDKGKRAARARWDARSNGANGNGPSNAPSMPGAMLHDAPSLVPGPDPRVNRSSTEDARGALNTDDDDDIALERSEKVRTVLERMADTRMEGRQIGNRPAYRSQVMAELEGEHLGDLAKLVSTHQTLAPTESFIGALLGEPNSLHLYRLPSDANA